MSAEIEKGFMPLTKVEQTSPSDIYIENLNLPSFVDKERIGVNVERIGRLKKIAGIKAILMIGTTGNETSEVTPNISGNNSDGSAFAAKSSAKVDMSTYADLGVKLGSDHNIRSRQIVLGVNYNLDEISQRITQTEEAARSVKPWAKEINKGLTTSIRHSGIDNIIKKGDDTFPYWVYLLSSMCLTDVIALDAYNVINQNHINAAENFAVVALCVALFNMGVLWNPDTRLSIFQGPQWDRAAALIVLTKTQKLIKDLHPDKK